MRLPVWYHEARVKPMTDIMMTTDEILDFAIQNEQNAADLYIGLASQAKKQTARSEYLQLSSEEKEHREILEKVKRGRMLIGIEDQVQDFRISDYAVDEPLGEDPDFDRILLFAIRQEEEAFRLYTALSELTPEGEIKDLLRNLAKEENRHKIKFESEYAARATHTTSK